MSPLRDAGKIVDDKAPWITLEAPPAALRKSKPTVLSVAKCGRCGTMTTVPRGVEVDVFVPELTQFMRLHRKCTATPRPL